MDILIFTDAATSSTMNVAIGAFFYFEKAQLQLYASLTNEELYQRLTEKVIYKQYVSKKSTWAEIKTAIDALNFIPHQSSLVSYVEMYTDCQSLFDLLGRRKEKLQKNNFITRSGKILQNAALYQELYTLTEKFQLHLFKMKGHDSMSKRASVQERIFAILDKLSRRKLREIVSTG